MIKPLIDQSDPINWL